ncbi:hypothetical protein [Bosea sp. BIWAKO-01]|uniref:hypothetical protein n=1 Tax=Bosea sp. BIWAKO-01 TaxID=506668 RepID=UPI000853AD81|nr:hypothetical protein [Bosea sp. BIWAKO-01]GAU87065.1 hypothetical protein BIWAKO_07018 [Bosea sp. BIWAKO-01]
MASTSETDQGARRMPARPAFEAHWRRPLLLLCLLALVSGLSGGLSLLGWPLPAGETHGALHGPLLICGLFGTLLAWKRALDAGDRWALLAPALSGGGTLALLAGMPLALGAGAFVLSAAVLCLAAFVIMLREPSVSTALVELAAISWLVGNLSWFLGNPAADHAGWWLILFVLNVASERMAGPGAKGQALREVAVLFAAGLLLSGAQNGLVSENGAILFGLGLLTLAGLFLHQDVTERDLRRSGRARFAALSMLLGNLWLGIAGAVLVAQSGGALGYGLSLHVLLIGFLFSLGFGHALIIMPAVSRRRVIYRPLMYLPLAALHLSLAVRVAGEVAGWPDLRAWSGLATLMALTGFALCVLAAASAKRSPGGAARIAMAR